MNCPKPSLHARARDFALDRLTEVERIEFEDHLVECAACTDTVSALGDRLLALERKVVNDAASEPSWIPRLHWSPALAAGLALIVLGYPAFLGLIRLPGARQEADRLRELNASIEGEKEALKEARAAAQSRIAELEQRPALEGALDVTYLSQPVRGEAPPLSVPIEPGARSVMLAVELSPGTLPSGGAACRFEVACGESVVWSSTRPAEAIRRQLNGRLGSLIVAIPAQVLPEAPCELRVTAGGEGSGRILFRAAFTPTRRS